MRDAWHAHLPSGSRSSPPVWWQRASEDLEQGASMRPFPLSRLAAAALACALLPAAAAAAPFSVQAVFPFGPAHVGVAFSDSVDVAGALLASHYTLTPGGGAPALVIQSVQLQDNQRTVILQTTAALPRAAAYA